jgi:signal transduction histidine kinase
MVLLYIITSTIVFSVFGIILYGYFEQSINFDYNKYLLAGADGVADSIDSYIEAEKMKSEELSRELDNQNIEDTLRLYFTKIFKRWMVDEKIDVNLVNFIVQIFDDRGNLIVSSKDLQSIAQLSQEAYNKAKTGERYYEDVSIESKQMSRLPVRMLTVPIIDNNKIQYIIRVIAPVRAAGVSLVILRIILFIFIPAIILITSVFGALLVGLTLRPVGNIINSLHKITERNLKMRLPETKTNDEVSRLAHTFNELLERLDKAFTSQKRFIEDLSHELKTPISSIRGELEIALKRTRNIEEYKEILGSNLEEIIKIIDLVEKLLLFSRFNTEESKSIKIRIDLSALALEVIEEMKPLAEQRENTITPEIEKGVILYADEAQIKSLFYNLLNNSIKFTRAGNIVCSICNTREKTLIEIMDSGIGMSEEDLPYIFDRYYRVIRSQNGHGYSLGLNIVKSIVDAHYGTIEVKSKLNVGTSFTITLPTIKGVN